MRRARTVRLTRSQQRELLAKPLEGATAGPRVSVIVAARNNGPFLREALMSALEQTIPCEVVYSDDYSTDNSVAIAKDIAARFPDRMIVVQSLKHQGVCAARNRGVAVSSGTHLIHLDGDDVLTPSFAAQHLAAMRAGAPFAYGPAEGFGEGPRAGVFWQVPATWAETDLWRGNSVNTSAMYARWAFDAAGGWQEGVGTMWDWDLALRASRYGEPVPSTAVLRYRQHAASWSHQYAEFTDAVRNDLQEKVRKLRARLSIGSIVSGRMGGGFVNEWIGRVAAAVREMRRPEKPDLVALCTGDVSASVFLRAAAPYSDSFSNTLAIDHSFPEFSKNENERRIQASTAIAEGMNRLRRLMRGDIHWIVEDDILVDRTAGESLLNALCAGGYHPPGAVSGIYRNRHVPDEFVAGFRGRDGTHQHLTHVPDTNGPIDFCGTGCLMLWRDRTPHCWRPLLGDTPAHDWEWCRQLSDMGRPLILVPKARCGHARTTDDILW